MGTYVHCNDMFFQLSESDFMRKQRRRRHLKRDAVPRNRRQAELRETALAVVALSRREGLKPSTAAKIEGIRLRTVLRYAGSAFEKHGNEYRVKKTDRLSRSEHGLGYLARNS